MTILWTNTVFSYNVLKFMTSKLDGNIFLNFYLDGASGLIGFSIAKPIYKHLRLRWTIFISVSITIFFLVWLFLFQGQYISSHWVQDAGASESHYPEGSPEDNKHNLKYLVPIIVMFVKIGINVAFLGVYTASFTEDIIFPFYKRATSTGICQFLARSIAISAPLVAELDYPTPLIILLILNIITFIVTFFLPTYQD